MTAAERRPTPSLPSAIARVHLIGICGTAMAALAGMFKARGASVTGSDSMAYPPVSLLIADLGIPIQLGYAAEHVEYGPDLVVVGNVVRRENPEAVRALQLGLPCVSLPEVLRLIFMTEQRGLVVAGTHGKTTTTSLVAWLLYHASRDPSYLVGGVPANFGSNYRIGRGTWFVLEGDEYDTAYFDKVPKLWHYPAELAIINNIEFDHADIYPSIDEIQWVFEKFAEQIRESGQLWVNGEDERAVAAGQHAKASVVTFGLSDRCHLWARDAEFHPGGTRAMILQEGRELGVIESPLWGEHNLRNTVGAIGLCLDAGLEFEEIVAGLPGFTGVVKRQQIKGEVRGVVIIDDFAHHPTAVRETLRAIRKRFPDNRLWAVFEAKSNTSRRAVFQHDYPPAFVPADRVILSEVWKQDNLPPEQRISIPQMADDIRALGKPVELIPAVEDIVAQLVAELEPGDVVVGLSGSDFSGFHGKLLAALKESLSVSSA